MCADNVVFTVEDKPKNLDFTDEGQDLPLSHSKFTSYFTVIPRHGATLHATTPPLLVQMPASGR